MTHWKKFSAAVIYVDIKNSRIPRMVVTALTAIVIRVHFPPHYHFMRPRSHFALLNHWLRRLESARSVLDSHSSYEGGSEGSLSYPVCLDAMVVCVNC